MKNRTPFTRLAPCALAVFALGATACGSSDSDDSAATTETTATQASTAPPTTASPAPVSEIDDSILTVVNTGSIQFGDDAPIAFDEVEIDVEFDIGAGPSPSLIGSYGTDGLVVAAVDLAAQGPTGEVTVFTPDGELFKGEGILTSEGDIFVGGGDLNSEPAGSTLNVTISMPVGLGASTFELDGNKAIVRGLLGSATFDQVQYLIDNHSEVDTLVLQQIQGSVNDDVNVETGRLVRNAGLSTFVPADGEIYSGGVDLFASGVTRTVESGATLGVHAWCCGPDGESAHELAKDDPAHDSQLAYWNEMLGAEAGPDFYFFTLEAAPFDGIHPMTPEELEEHLLTAE